MRQKEIKNKLDQEIKKECQKKSIDFPRFSLDENLNLLDSGIFDSLGILQLISKLEEELNTDIDLSEYSPSQFTNYCQLLNVLEKSVRSDSVEGKI